MKSLFRTVLLLFAVLTYSTCFVSCESELPDGIVATKDPTRLFSVSDSSLNFIAEGESKTVEVSADGEITLESSESWITTKLAGKDLNITVDENISPESRNGKVFVGIKGVSSLKHEIAIEQAGKVYSFSVDKYAISATSAATTDTISLKTNDEWTITTNLNWVVLSPKSGTGNAKIEVIISENTKDTYRDGFIVIKGKNSGENQQIAIGQTGKSNYGYENGYEWVDFGLPSGNLWATCNLGATKPEEYGLYFAWGETIGYTRDSGHNFSKEEYKFYNSGFTKYGNQYEIGSPDNKTVLELEDDAAHVLWGGTWHIPSPEDVKELSNARLFKWSIVELNGIRGMLLTKWTGIDSIFLPFAGEIAEDGLREGKYSNFYWTNKYSGIGSGQPLWPVDDEDFPYINDGENLGIPRYRGLPIRAVCNPN